MTLLINILIIVIVAVVVIVILNHYFFQSNILYDKLIKAQTVKGDGIGGTGLVYPLTTNNPTVLGSGISGTFIPHSQMPVNNSNNFMFSVWFFIDNYTSNLGKYKKVASIIGLNDSSPQGYASSLDVALDQYQNNLIIGINTSSTGSNTSTTSTASSGQFLLYEIENIPLQKWNCLIISVNDRTMDVYLEGKLINSFILQNFYKSFTNENIWLGNNDKNYYDGYLTRVRYQASSVSPEEAYSIYKEGINSNLMGNFLNKYKLKVGFYEYDTEKANFVI